MKPPSEHSKPHAADLPGRLALWHDNARPRLKFTAVSRWWSGGLLTRHPDRKPQPASP